MNREDIVRMAQEAGLHRQQHNLMSNPVQPRFSYDGYEENLEAFAALVAKHTLANIDPSSFMSWQEGYEAGKQDGRCKYCTDGCPACDARKLPAQRTWVGLTDEEYTELWGMKPDLLNFFHKIEAKLKEKNT